VSGFLSAFGWIDAVLLAAVLLGVVFGIKRGLSHELAVLLGFAVAVVATCSAYDPLARRLAENLHWNLELLRLIAVVALLALSLAAMWILRAALGLLMEFAFKGWFERVGGAVAGGLRWGLVCLVALLALSFVPVSALQRAILFDSFAGREILPLLADSYNDLAARGELLQADRPAGVAVPQMVMPPVDGGW